MMNMVEQAIANEIYKYFKEQNIKKKVTDDFWQSAFSVLPPY